MKVQPPTSTIAPSSTPATGLVPRINLGPSSFLAIVLSGVWCAQTLFAAAPDAKLRLERDITEVSLDDLMTIKVPSVTGASRFEQKETDAPASVTVVTAEDIRIHGWRSLGEALNSVRGLYSTYTRSYTLLGVRGYNRPGDFNGHTLLLVDGVRLNENIYSTSLLGPEAIIDVSLIDHIEVIRGSSSSLYGSNAFFGVINVVTKDASAFKNGAASVGWGSFDSGRGELTLGRTFESGLKLLLHGSWAESQGPTLYFPKFDAPGTNNGVIPDLDSEDTQKLFGKAKYGDFTLTAAYSRRAKQVPLPYTGSPFNDRAARETDRQAFVDLRYATKLDSGWDVQAHASYNWYWFDAYFSYLDVIPTDPNRAVVNHDIGRGRWMEGEVQVNRKIADKHTLTFGGDIRRNIQQSQKNFDIAPYALYQDDNRDSSNYGIFAQGDIQLSKQLSLNAGVRLDHYSTFGSTTNPRFALIYHPSSRTTIKLLHGTAFRAPNPYEFAYSGANALPNPTLGPEKIRSSEIVVEQQIGKHYRLTLSAYRNSINDLIEQVVVDPTDGTSQFQNRAKSIATGFEAEFEARWKNGVTAKASFARQRAEDDTTGAMLSNSPRNLAKALIAIPIVEDRVIAGIEAQYRGSVLSTIGNRVDDYWFTNLNVTAKDVAMEGLDLSAGVFNLFDERYEFPGSDPDASETIRQDGRTFFISATYRF
jgi:outer membrane receptor for ferrienterochelin and colicins